MTVPPGITLGIAGLHASLHSLRILANKGFVSPSEIDESFDGVTETLENLPPEFHGLIQQTFDPLFAEIKQAAAANWKEDQ